jgi:hypothetical protein
MSSSSSRILAAATALALAATAAPIAAAADSTAHLTNKSPILFVDNEIGKGTVAIAFRTDKPLDLKANGKSIDGDAGVKGHLNSLSTLVKSSSKPAYIAYIGGVSVGGAGQHLKVGHRYQVTIDVGDQKITRTVKLQANTKQSKVKRQLGYY